MPHKRVIAESSDSDESPKRRGALAHRRFYNERQADPVHDDYSPTKLVERAKAKQQADEEMRQRVAQETEAMMDNGVHINPTLRAMLGDGRSEQLPQPKDEPEELLPTDPSQQLRVPGAEGLYEADEETTARAEEQQEEFEQEERDVQEAEQEEAGTASDDSLSLSGVEAFAGSSAPRRARLMRAQADQSVLDLYEEDEEMEDGEDDAPDRSQRVRAPKTARKQSKRDWKTIPGGYFVDEATKDMLLKQYTSTFIGSVAHLKPGPWKPNQAGQFAKAVGGVSYRRRVLTCPFARQAGCTVHVRESQTSSGEWVLEECGGPHTDHSLVVQAPARGAPLALKAVALSPSKMQLPAAKALEAVRDSIGVVYEDEQRQLTRARHRHKKKAETAIIPAEARGRFAGVHHFCQAFTKAAIQDFGIHSVYIIGEPKIDAATQTINIAMSSENLLLNVYRQEQTGLPCILQVDTTLRLVLEGHNCMLFGLVDPAQKFHTIGYGFCSEEDTAAHHHIITNLKAEVERVVAQRIADQQPI